MMKIHALAVLAMAVTLGACGQKADGNGAAAANSAASANAENTATAGGMDNMSMAAGAKMAKGTGKVTALNKAAGTITLAHGPIAELNWPAMTMAFTAAPALIDSVKIGDEVDFDLKLEGSDGEITALSKK